MCSSAWTTCTALDLYYLVRTDWLARFHPINERVTAG